MYKIIGTDHKEYGPVTAEEVAQWIVEGRADGRTAAKMEPAGEWKPLSAFPEFAAALAAGPFASVPPPDTGPLPAVPVEELLGRDYDLDIGSCLSRSWTLVKQNLGPMLGITFLVVLIMIIINQGLGLISRSATQTIMQNWIVRHEFTTEGLGLVLLTWVLSMPVQTILMGGLYMYYLKLIRGEEAGIGDAFSGITTALLPLALLGLLMGVLVLLGFALCLIPGFYLAVAWYFAIPLVIDKQLGAWEAMQLSLKMVNKHWFMVFALVLVVGLIAACGICALCIGILVTMPIAYAALMYAYEDILAGGPVKRSTAMNCLLVNQLATPGLGSLMGRRVAAGLLQLSLALAGAALIVGWFFQISVKFYRLITNQPEAPDRFPWLGRAGFVLLGAAWLLAWITSLSLLREARLQETSESVAPSQPPKIK